MTTVTITEQPISVTVTETGIEAQVIETPVTVEIGGGGVHGIVSTAADTHTTLYDAGGTTRAIIGTASPHLTIGALTSTITAISLANPTEVTTAAAHELAVGDVVLISGTDSTPIINGSRTVITVPTPTTFTIAGFVIVVGANGSVEKLSVTRVNGQLGIGATPATGASVARVVIGTWRNLGAGTASLVQLEMAGTQTANGTQRNGVTFTGQYDINGFNLTNALTGSYNGFRNNITCADSIGGGTVALALNFSAGQSHGQGGGVIITNGAMYFSEAYVDASSGANVIGTHRAFWTKNQGHATIDTSVGLDIEAQSGSVTASLSIRVQGTGPNRISPNTQLFSQTEAFGGGVGVLGIANAGTIPGTNPAGGGVLYSEGGALKWRGSSGTVTVLGVA